MILKYCKNARGTFVISYKGFGPGTKFTAYKDWLGWHMVGNNCGHALHIMVPVELLENKDICNVSYCY